LPDAALFFGWHVKNLADTFAFMADSYISVLSHLGGITFFAAFGKKQDQTIW
jgi:hypothetical protein